MSALLMPDALTLAILRAVQAASPLSKGELETRKIELTAEIDELSFTVAHLLDKAGEFDPHLSPQHWLGIKVKSEPVSAELVKNASAHEKDVMSNAIAQAIRA